MDVARRSRSWARAGLGAALVALLATAACASRTPAATTAGGPETGTLAASSTSGIRTSAASPAPSSPLATPPLATPTPTPTTPPKAAGGTELISCTATVSNPTPKRGMQTHVIVQTASGAQVSVASSSAAAGAMLVPRAAVNADGDGRADLTVTPQVAGAKVHVQVQAAKAGATASCATSFTPVDLPQVTDSPGLPPIQITTQPIPPANNNT